MEIQSVTDLMVLIRQQLMCSRDKGTQRQHWMTLRVNTLASDTRAFVLLLMLSFLPSYAFSGCGDVEIGKGDSLLGTTWKYPLLLDRSQTQPTRMPTLPPFPFL